MDDILALIGRVHQGDKEARDILAEKNMGLVHSIAKRFQNRGVEMEDLIQIGSIGLLKAIDKFDLSYNVKFSTYAVPMITGEIKRYLRDDGMMKVSRSLKETAAKAYAARERLLQKKNREPDMEELATE
ncbi:MAG TPA: sigma-70 family RNA polymerase sigma factor, partial [Candidatus Blautia ornithocaccae]|nr:sigma-70 family RNA polymerase sigma factor [Candidatus Blautia ornithocaccae]